MERTIEENVHRLCQQRAAAMDLSAASGGLPAHLQLQGKAAAVLCCSVLPPWASLRPQVRGGQLAFIFTALAAAWRLTCMNRSLRCTCQQRKVGLGWAAVRVLKTKTASSPEGKV